MNSRSRLELVIGPMFSQKCLNPDFKVYLYNGEEKTIDNLQVDDELIHPDGYPVRILSLTSGKTTMYHLKNKEIDFYATPNHVLVFKNKLYYYSPVSEKRGLLFFLNHQLEIQSLPVLQSNLDKLVQELQERGDILPEGSVVELTAERYAKFLQYTFLLQPYKVPLHFEGNYRNRGNGNVLAIDYDEVSQEILFSPYDQRSAYLYQLVNESEITFQNKSVLTLLLKNHSHDFKRTLVQLIKSLNLNIFWSDDRKIVLSGLDTQNFLRSGFFEEEERLGERLIIKKTVGEMPFVGFELEHDGLFLSQSGYVMHNSTFLVNLFRKYKYINKKVSIYSHTLDATRYSKYFLTTHDRQQVPCSFLSRLSSLVSDEDYLSSDIVIIEEAQFFPDLEEFIISQLDTTNKHFIVCGLSSDYQRKPIGQILQLVPHADIINKLDSFCHLCADGTPAIYSRRISEGPEGNNEGTEQICIGGSEAYQSVCRFHYLSK